MRLPIAGCGTLTRRTRMPTPSGTQRRLGRLWPQAAKASFAPMEARQRLRKIAGGEFGPHAVGEMQFGVGTLPEQEIGQAFLAAGSDDEIDVAQACLPGDQLREARARELACAADLCSRAEDRFARRVVDRDAHMQGIATDRGDLGMTDFGGKASGKAVAAADHGEADAIANKTVR